jgi:hypothetical protein|tara:strand:- start:174 stop:1133 length:960 start_codon:yes stop_codon:yes gene_type:complete
MAYRDPTFNANMLTDLLDTYLTNQSKERERYFQVAQQQDKPMIRQGADGYLYYADKRKDDFGQRVFPDIEKPSKTGSQGLTTEEFFYKPGSDENQVGQSVLLQKKGGQYFTADTQQPVDPTIFANLTKQKPSSQTPKDPKGLKTAYYADGRTREFDIRNGVYTWLDTNEPILNTEWSNFTLQQDDRDEKIETKIRTAYKNLINKTLKPVYAKFADDTNFKMDKKWPGYQDMLEKEKTLIDNMFQGKVPIFTSIEDFKMQFPKEIQGKKDEEIIDAAEQVFARSVSSGTLPKFYLHTTAFGSESEFSKMMSNFRNVNLGN